MGPGAHPPGKVPGTDLAAQTGLEGPGPPRVGSRSGSDARSRGKGSVLHWGRAGSPRVTLDGVGVSCCPHPQCRPASQFHGGAGVWGGRG